MFQNSCRSQASHKACTFNFFVDAKDPLSIDLWTEEVFIQKLNYIHNNPVTYPWNLVQDPEEYKYSSAKFYETGIDEFGVLTHYRD